MKRYLAVMAMVLSCCVLFSTLLMYGQDAQIVWALSPRQIVIDAGHGGIDGGAQSESGVLEKNINLSVAQRCELLYALFGIRSVMTRTQDCSIDDGTGETIAQRKAEDIRRRVTIANTYGDLLISIHMNSFPDPQYWGSQCFYSQNHPNGELLAKKIQESMQKINAENQRVHKPAQDSIYLMKHTLVPAVIVECGFLSNPEESLHLSDPNYQTQLALAICAGTLTYYAQ